MISAGFINLKIISPKEEFFNGQVSSVSSENSAGKFDILPRHANFITFIHNKPIVVKKLDKKILTYQFPMAIIYATNNRVNIYTDIQLEHPT
jgi:F0F1-type ATP synthase epsilon subunit